MAYCEHCEHCNAETLDGGSLRKRRTQAAVSLRDMAKRTGITAAYLCDIEYNRRRVKLTGTGRRILSELEALGV